MGLWRCFSVDESVGSSGHLLTSDKRKTCRHFKGSNHDLDGRCEELANILLGMADEDLLDIEPLATMLATL